MIRRVKTLSELFAAERSAQQMSLEREVLPDRSEAREKRLGALWIAKPSPTAAHVHAWADGYFLRG